MNTDTVYNQQLSWWNLAEWLERLTANAKVATVLVFDFSIFRHSGIWGAADEAVLNEVHKKVPSAKKSPY